MVDEADTVLTLQTEHLACFKCNSYYVMVLILDDDDDDDDATDVPNLVLQACLTRASTPWYVPCRLRAVWQAACCLHLLCQTCTGVCYKVDDV